MIEVPIKQLAILASYIEPLAFYFGVFLPSLPYTIFMIVVVGWILAVLQSIIAAPLWAVMHMTPDRTFIGSQTQGYLLLLSLFARPALAVVGLFAAILISDPIIDYIATGFFAMRGAIVSSTGTVGAISEFLTFAWWLMMFGLTLLPVLYMTFGLPQILPDHVLRWIGAGVSDLGETSAVSQMRGGMAAIGSGAGRIGKTPTATLGRGIGLLPGGDSGDDTPDGGDGGGRGRRGGGGRDRRGGGGSLPQTLGNPQGVTPKEPETQTSSPVADNSRSSPAADNSRSTGDRSGKTAGAALSAGVAGAGIGAGAAAAKVPGGKTVSGESKAASSPGGVDTRSAAFSQGASGEAPVNAGQAGVSGAVNSTYDSRYAPPPADTNAAPADNATLSSPGRASGSDEPINTGENTRQQSESRNT